MLILCFSTFLMNAGQSWFSARRQRGDCQRLVQSGSSSHSRACPDMAGQYHVGVGAPPMLCYSSLDWDVHWGYGLLTHGHMALEGCMQLIVVSTLLCVAVFGGPWARRAELRACLSCCLIPWVEQRPSRRTTFPMAVFLRFPGITEVSVAACNATVCPGGYFLREG